MSFDDNAPLVDGEPTDGVITLAGELDANDVNDLRPLFDHVGEGTGWVIVDVSQVTFMDSSVLGLLVASRSAATEADRDMCLVGATRNVERLFSVTNLDSVFVMVDTIDDVPAFPG